MQESDLQELQKETFVVVVAITMLLAITLAYAMLYVDVYRLLWWVPSLVALGACLISIRLYKNDRFRQATYVFIGGCIISIISFVFWPQLSFYQREIYLLMLVVAMAGLIISPRAAFGAANFAAILTLAATAYLYAFDWDMVLLVGAPLAMIYGIAMVSWISSSHLTTTLQWAYNSQARAQDRSRELFESQQELKRTYQLQETTNYRLQEAEAAARQASEFKTRFITNLSHELRTPLSAIINFSFLLSKNRYGDVNEEQREYLTRIHSAGELLLDIVNDLLDLAKIEAGQMDLFMEPIDLEAISRSVIDTTSGLITDKPVELKLEIAPNLPEVYGDNTRIRQILINLLGNAEKYTDEGTITLKVNQQDTDYLKISVIDTGAGIREQDFERIFQEFQQTQEAFTMRKVGTGLGLPISKKFAELHGGDLWVESEYGKGSAFHFILPILAFPEVPTRRTHFPEMVAEEVIN